MTVSSIVVNEAVYSTIGTIQLYTYTETPESPGGGVVIAGRGYEVIYPKPLVSTTSKTYWHQAYDPVGEQFVQWENTYPMLYPFIGVLGSGSEILLQTYPDYLCFVGDLMGGRVIGVVAG